MSRIISLHCNTKNSLQCAPIAFIISKNLIINEKDSTLHVLDGACKDILQTVQDSANWINGEFIRLKFSTSYASHSMFLNIDYECNYYKLNTFSHCQYMCIKLH